MCASFLPFSATRKDHFTGPKSEKNESNCSNNNKDQCHAKSERKSREGGRNKMWSYLFLGGGQGNSLHIDGRGGCRVVLLFLFLVFLRFLFLPFLLGLSLPLSRWHIQRHLVLHKPSVVRQYLPAAADGGTKQKNSIHTKVPQQQPFAILNTTMMIIHRNPNPIHRSNEPSIHRSNFHRESKLMKEVEHQKTKDNHVAQTTPATQKKSTVDFEEKKNQKKSKTIKTILVSSFPLKVNHEMFFCEWFQFFHFYFFEFEFNWELFSFIFLSDLARHFFFFHPPPGQFISPHIRHSLPHHHALKPNDPFFHSPFEFNSWF